MHRHATTMLAVAVLLLSACAAQPATDAAAGPRATTPAPHPVPADDAIDVHDEAVAASPCDWTHIALREHRAMVVADARPWLAGASAGSGLDELVQLLERPPQPLGDIQGAWQVRSLQFDVDHVYAYPYFKARIDADACGHRFAKTTGSQRRSGVLYPDEDQPGRLAFLGASTVNDDPPRAYDPRRPRQDQHPGESNSAGSLVRIGPDELLMLLDATPDRFEVYHLRR